MAVKQKINSSASVVNRPFHFQVLADLFKYRSWDFSRRRFKTSNNKQTWL